MNFLKEDAMHVQLPFKDEVQEFEWWYFDANSDDGTHIVAMYSVNDTRLKPRKPSIRYNAYYENGDSAWELEEFTRDEVTVSYEKCEARFNNQYCVDFGEYYEIYTMINGNGCKLKFYPQIPHYFTPENPPNMGWTVAAPHAKVEGIIYKDGKEIPFKGEGYHDHNWGHNNMNKRYKQWYWGKIHTPDLCLDYGLMVMKDDSLLLGLLAIDKDGTVLCEPNPETMRICKSELKDVVFDSEMGEEYARNVKLFYKKDGIEISVNIELDRIVMSEKTKVKPGESCYRYVGKEHTIIKKENTVKEYDTSELHEIVYLY